LKKVLALIASFIDKQITIKHISALFLLLFSSLAIAEPFIDSQNSTLFRLFFSTSSAIIFGCLCFFLYRLNKKLQNNIKAHQATEQMMSKLSSAVTNSGASIVITDERGIIEYVNDKFCRITGYDVSETINKPINILRPNSEEFKNQACILDTQYLLEQDSWEGEMLCSKKDKTEFWNAVTISAVFDKDGTISNYVLSAVDVTALKNANKKMEHLALFDSLTGLANRRLFIDRLHHSVLNARRHKKITALLFLDLDQFKRINDTLGHQAGDQLLLRVADRLQSCVRSQDTVARLGGDEFTILLNDISEIESIQIIAKKILHTLKEPIKLGKHEIIVSTSIGITLSPNDSIDSDTLMKNADLALYMAKENGRDGYHFFTDALNIRANKLLETENELREAIKHGDFYLNYQPQINLKTGEIASVEALIRWKHPTKGEMSPYEFIPVAEETGLIVQIGQWVLQQACLEIQELNNLTGKSLRVAVNLSSRQFEDPELVNIVSKALSDSGLKAQNLELEVTESMLMHDINRAIHQLNKIKSTGSTLTIDDFGSGYSSLSYLKSLPVDTLKIDQSFVYDIPEDLNAMEIASAVIAIAHKLNLRVVAEGVENIDQRDFLVINGCDYAQGYFFSRPLSCIQMHAFFESCERHTA
jgi:diguanylate cyclase (GGDEF)-like protein/PAS domain S-box-containing protein